MTQKDILQLESSDMRQAYLFEENGRWYAYEHSANRIEKFVKGFVDFKHKVQDVPQSTQKQLVKVALSGWGFFVHKLNRFAIYVLHKMCNVKYVIAKILLRPEKTEE